MQVITSKENEYSESIDPLDDFLNRVALIVWERYCQSFLNLKRYGRYFMDHDECIEQIKCIVLEELYKFGLDDSDFAEVVSIYIDDCTMRKDSFISSNRFISLLEKSYRGRTRARLLAQANILRHYNDIKNGTQELDPDYSFDAEDDFNFAEFTMDTSGNGPLEHQQKEPVADEVEDIVAEEENINIRKPITRTRNSADSCAEYTKDLLLAKADPVNVSCESSYPNPGYVCGDITIVERDLYDSDGLLYGDVYIACKQDLPKVRKLVNIMGCTENNNVDDNENK